MATATSDSSVTFDYKAFVSYSTDPDYRLVRSTESFLESFHKLPTPSDICLQKLEICVDGSDFTLQSVKRREADGSTGPGPVARAIDEKLAQSEKLLVFCSRNLADSKWVSHEIKWFLENRPEGSILLVVTEGKDPVENPSEVFSPQIMEAGLHTKPWYDFRGASKKRWYDFRGAIRRRRESANWEKVRDPDDARTQLAAHLNGTDSGRLQPVWHREQKRRQRRQFWFSVVIAVFMGMLAAKAAWQWRQAMIAKEEADIARDDAIVAKDAAKDALQKQLDMFTRPLGWAGSIAADTSKQEHEFGDVKGLLTKLDLSVRPIAHTGSIQESINALQAAVVIWKLDCNQNPLTQEEPRRTGISVRNSVYYLGKAYRVAWNLLDKDLNPEAKRLFRKLSIGPAYDRAIVTCEKLAQDAENPEEIAKFERLYWAELVLVEDKGVEKAMMDFRKSLFGDRSGLSGFASKLRTACEDFLDLPTVTDTQ